MARFNTSHWRGVPKPSRLRAATDLCAAWSAVTNTKSLTLLAMFVTFLLSVCHFADLLRYSCCARSAPLPSLRCRRPFTVRRTRQARVTPACAFPCPIRRSSRAAAPSSVPRAPALPRVCAPLGAGLRPLRAHAPVVGQVHSARVVHAAAAARRTRTRALPRHAKYVCWPAGAVC